MGESTPDTSCRSLAESFVYHPNSRFVEDPQQIRTILAHCVLDNTGERDCCILYKKTDRRIQLRVPHIRINVDQYISEYLYARHSSPIQPKRCGRVNCIAPNHLYHDFHSHSTILLQDDDDEAPIIETTPAPHYDLTKYQIDDDCDVMDEVFRHGHKHYVWRFNDPFSIYGKRKVIEGEERESPSWWREYGLKKRVEMDIPSDVDDDDDDDTSLVNIAKRSRR